MAINQAVIFVTNINASFLEKRLYITVITILLLNLLEWCHYYLLLMTTNTYRNKKYRFSTVSKQVSPQTRCKQMLQNCISNKIK